MLLYLLRHAEPDSSPTFQDDTRPLTAFGHSQAATVAQFFRRSLLSVDTIYCSPYLRAVQTAEAILRIFPSCTLEHCEPLAQASANRQLFNLLNRSNAESVLLVGHEPQLLKLASTLLGESGKLELEFKKCSLACVETALPLPSNLALLKWLITFEQMKLAISA